MSNGKATECALLNAVVKNQELFQCDADKIQYIEPSATTIVGDLRCSASQVF
jgi:hypothetical protein